MEHYYHRYNKIHFLEKSQMMYRSFFLPAFEELRFLCFPHSVGKFTKPLDHNVSREKGVKDFSLHFVTAGKGYLQLNGAIYALKQGDAFLHTPGQTMRYYTDSEDPWDIYWMQFNGYKLSEFLLERGFHESSLWTVQPDSMLEDSFLALIDEIQCHTFKRPSRISALTYAVLVEFASHALTYSNKRGWHHLDVITRILPLMQKNARLPYNLEEWADLTGLTPNYFCGLFKKVTRMTPLAYITKCRIQSSKEMLLGHPDKPIKEIAIDCGYPSVSYFNKTFLKMEGVTPTEFRNTHLT